ncbi:hypothetical protein D3C72_1375300 [compost metagenome]
MIRPLSFDPGLDHVAAQSVVDHVAAVGLDEAEALVRPVARHQVIFLQLVQRRLAVDAPGQIGVGDGVFRPAQLAGQGQKLSLGLGRRGV